MNLPEPPVHSFASDNAAGVSPEVLDALVEANEGTALAYGDDAWSARASDALRELFDAPVESFFCWGGTGANVVGLASVLEPYDAVVCTSGAHVLVDEAGALGRFAGVTLLPVDADDGKLRPGDWDRWLQWQSSEHHPRPRAVTVTQSTELGTLYTVAELGAVCEAAHAGGLLVHVDGARIANAVAALDTEVPTLLRDTGVDVCTFGLTKDGAMYGETVVFLEPELAAKAKYVRKQAGQLSSKTRFVAAQVLALLDGDLWLRNAAHANAMATDLATAVATIPGVRVVNDPPAVNAVFAEVPLAAIEALQRWSFFWEWDLTQSLVRWMTSFATTAEDVERFAAGIRAIVGNATR